MENDGKKYDYGKVRMDLVPLDVVENIGKVLTYGAQKYSDNSWQNLPDFWKRYKAALLRHLTAIDKGELIDPESGLPHIDHVLCNTVFLDWGFHHGKAISIEAIWWETQDIDVNKNRIGNPTLHVHFIRKNEEGITHGIVHSKEVTQDLNIGTVKNEIIKEIVEVLEEGYRKVEKDLWNN